MSRLLAPAATVAREGFHPDGNYLAAVETVADPDGASLDPDRLALDLEQWCGSARSPGRAG